MLVGLIRSGWSTKKKDVINNGLVGLEKSSGEPVKGISDIASLTEGENLWLYSHGSDTTFCGMTVEKLAGWLKAQGMPPGKRVITLKGCRTKAYAIRLQELLNSKKRYRGVKVEGFAGQASYTSKEGTMSIKVPLTEREKQRIALERLKADRDLSEKGVSKTQREKQVAKVGADTEKSLSRKEAVRDQGLGSYEPLNERQERRIRRDEARTEDSGTDTETQPPPTTTAKPRVRKRIIIDSDDEPESSPDDVMETDKDADTEMDSMRAEQTTVPQPTVTPQQTNDTMDTS